MKKPEKIVIAVTGASGAPLALHFLQSLLPRVTEVHLLFSGMGQEVFYHELDIPKKKLLMHYLTECFGKEVHKLSLWNPMDYSAPFASGSGTMDAMVIIPCSMKTLSAVANGYSNTLIERAADVMLKEKRPLILVPRETPLNDIHLRNMINASRGGAVILPPVPAFYTHPQTLQDIKAYISGKILDSLNISHHLFPAWSPDKNYDQSRE
jgi:flavin prenyltransferase